jgi:hypothetical protein
MADCAQLCAPGTYEQVLVLVDINGWRDLEIETISILIYTPRVVSFFVYYLVRASLWARGHNDELLLYWST